MTDFTASQSLDYDKHLEDRYSVQHSAEIQCESLRVLRSLREIDLYDALADKSEEIKHLVIQGHEAMLGFVVRQAIQKWADDVAKRVVEA